MDVAKPVSTSPTQFARPETRAIASSKRFCSWIGSAFVFRCKAVIGAAGSATSQNSPQSAAPHRGLTTSPHDADEGY
jgi:hypothetical protein